IITLWTPTHLLFTRRNTYRVSCQYKNPYVCIMKIITIVSCLFVAQLAFGQQAPKVPKTKLDANALLQPLYGLDGKQTTAGAILEAYKGKTVLLYIWAMWCPDCLKGFPGLQAFQKANPDVPVIYFSLDREEQRWKDGIQKFALNGAHFWFRTEWNNDFTNAIDLDRISRYLTIAPDGRSAHYYSVKADDPA